MIRAAILGLGGVAERIHLPACRSLSDIEIVAASEPDDDRRPEMASRFGIPTVFADSHELLNEVSPDLVLVGTPPDSHSDLCLAALGAGADVVCEKPFMQTVDEADEVIAAAEAHGRRILVNTQYRHMPIYSESQRRIRDGEFGRLFFVNCWQQMYNPPHTSAVPWRASLTRATLFEFGTHALDLICFFLDDLPEAITAHIPQISPEMEADVLVHVLLRFPRQRLAALTMNRVTHAPERYLEMRLDCDDASLRISLGGVARAGLGLVRHRHGRRVLPRFSFAMGGESRVEVDGRSRLLVRERRPAYASATAANLRVFLDERERGLEPSYRSVRHARDVLRIALKGYDSAELGTTVEL